MSDTIDHAWVCADCGTRQGVNEICIRCGSVRVVLLSVIHDTFGGLNQFEFDISSASWVLLNALEMDDEGRETRQMVEEYIWFIEREAKLAAEAMDACSQLVTHMRSCGLCRNGLNCLDARRWQKTSDRCKAAWAVTFRTVKQIRERHQIENRPARDV
jgi:hypothetical protein